MEMNFCRRCGQPLTNVRDHVYMCKDGHTIYANQSPAAGVFFVSSDRQRVLLTTRSIDPGKGMLGIPGGFLDAAESAEAAVIREVREEIGLEPEHYGELSYIISQYNDYTYKAETLPVITFTFWAELKDDSKIKVADEVENVAWYPLTEVDFDRIDAEDVRTGLRKLQRILGAVNA